MLGLTGREESPGLYCFIDKSTYRLQSPLRTPTTQKLALLKRGSSGCVRSLVSSKAKSKQETKSKLVSIPRRTFACATK